MNNDEFIDGLRKQDPAAARHLNECLVPSIWRFVYFRVNRNQHLAEDIVSETVLALVDAVVATTQIEHPAAWLRTVASRRVQDHYRAAARVQHLLENGEQHSNNIDDQDAPAKHDEELKQQTVRDAMDELPDEYRLALEWKYVDKVGVREIASRLDATEKSAESLLFRARNALRKLLRNEFAETESNETKLADVPTPSAESRSPDAVNHTRPHQSTIEPQKIDPRTTYLGVQFSDGS